MSVILKRLARSLNLSIGPEQSFASVLNTRPFASNTDLVIQHARINIEYSVLCSKIACEWSSQSPMLKQQMNEALETAELLEMIYRDYLDVPREISRLQKEQQLMRAWLNNDGMARHQEANTLYVSKWIRDQTVYLNLPRLFAVRARRLLMAIVPLTTANSAYHQSMQTFDRYAAPFFSHLAWLYFIPRITNHLVMILKHTIEHDGMTDEEKALGWQTRLWVQLQGRWPDLSNDLPWLIANSFSCFVLVGPLLPYNIILSICMQFFEIAQSFSIYVVEMNYLYQQRAEYINARDDYTEDSEDYQQLDAYIEHLNKRIDYESHRLLISVVNTSILLLAIILAAPIFAPGYAVAGGVIAVSSTIGTYAARQYVDSEKPQSNLFQLLDNHSIHQEETNPMNQGKP